MTTYRRNKRKRDLERWIIATYGINRLEEVTNQLENGYMPTINKEEEKPC